MVSVLFPEAVIRPDDVIMDTYISVSTGGIGMETERSEEHLTREQTQWIDTLELYADFSGEVHSSQTDVVSSCFQGSFHLKAQEPLLPARTQPVV